jgi:hypothetical protein
MKRFTAIIILSMSIFVLILCSCQEKEGQIPSVHKYEDITSGKYEFFAICPAEKYLKPYTTDSYEITLIVYEGEEEISKEIIGDKKHKIFDILTSVLYIPLAFEEAKPLVNIIDLDDNNQIELPGKGSYKFSITSKIDEYIEIDSDISYSADIIINDTASVISVTKSYDNNKYLFTTYSPDDVDKFNELVSIYDELSSAK